MYVRSFYGLTFVNHHKRFDFVLSLGSTCSSNTYSLFKIRTKEELLTCTSNELVHVIRKATQPPAESHALLDYLRSEANVAEPIYITKYTYEKLLSDLEYSLDTEPEYVPDIEAEYSSDGDPSYFEDVFPDEEDGDDFPNDY